MNKYLLSLEIRSLGKLYLNLWILFKKFQMVKLQMMDSLMKNHPAICPMQQDLYCLHHYSMLGALKLKMQRKIANIRSSGNNNKDFLMIKKEDDFDILTFSIPNKL